MLVSIPKANRTVWNDNDLNKSVVQKQLNRTINRHECRRKPPTEKKEGTGHTGGVYGR